MCYNNEVAIQDHDIFKKRLDASGHAITEPEKHEIGPHQVNEDSYKNGSYCGSCYGAGSEGECCDTCEEVLIPPFHKCLDWN